MTENALTFVLLGLASYRLARLLVNEDAPFGLARHLRNMLSASELECIEQGKAGRISSALCCVHCTGVYTSAVVMMLWIVGLEPVIWLFAISGAVSWLFDR